MSYTFKVIIALLILGAVYVQEVVKPTIVDNATKLRGALTCPSSDHCSN